MTLNNIYRSLMYLSILKKCVYAFYYKKLLGNIFVRNVTHPKALIYIFHPACHTIVNNYTNISIAVKQSNTSYLSYIYDTD